MARKFSIRYIDGLFAKADESALAQISSEICGWAGFRADEPDYALPGVVFVFVELLLWAAQSQRSGSRTYYEATPPPRMAAMLQRMNGVTAVEFSDAYRLGVAIRNDETAAAAVDGWVATNEGHWNCWLWELLRNHR